MKDYSIFINGRWNSDLYTNDLNDAIARFYPGFIIEKRIGKDTIVLTNKLEQIAFNVGDKVQMQYTGLHDETGRNLDGRHATVIARHKDGEYTVAYLPKREEIRLPVSKIRRRDPQPKKTIFDYV